MEYSWWAIGKSMLNIIMKVFNLGEASFIQELGGCGGGGGLKIFQVVALIDTTVDKNVRSSRFSIVHDIGMARSNGYTAKMMMLRKNKCAKTYAAQS